MLEDDFPCIYEIWAENFKEVFSGHRKRVEGRTLGEFPSGHASDRLMCEKQTRLLRGSAARLHGGHGHQGEHVD